MIYNQFQEGAKLSDLIKVSQEFDTYKADIVAPAAAFEVNKNGELIQKPNGNQFAMTPVTFTRHALRQASKKCGLAYDDLSSLPIDYMMTLQAQAPALFAANMNEAMTRLEGGKDWTVRTYRNQARAVLSGEYLKFDNTGMMELIQEVLTEDESSHRISTRSYVTPDEMVTDILFKDIQTGLGGGNGRFALGVRITNGETGLKQGGVYPIAKRGDCDNSIVIDDREHSEVFKHYGKNTEVEKRLRLRLAIQKILPFSGFVIQQLIAAESKELPKFSDVVNGLAYKFGWSEEITGTIFAGTEQKRSLAGIINGMTYAAHATPGITREAMTELEFTAGQILMDSKMSIIREARALHDGKEAREAKKEQTRLDREERKRRAALLAEEFED